MTGDLRLAELTDAGFIERAIRACRYDEDDATTVPAALRAILSGSLDYWIANGRCGGGVWWKTEQEAWLTLFYREGPSHGLREDCRLLRQGMDRSIACHRKPVRVYAAVSAYNPHSKGLLWIHEKFFDLKPYQTITRSDWIGEQDGRDR